MVEYTVAFARSIVEALEPARAEVPSEETFWSAVETLEGLEGLLVGLPASERHGAVSGLAIEKEDALWVPTVRNCRLSVGVSVEQDGLVSFAVGDESSADGALTNYFSAKTAAAHALRNPEERNIGSELIGAGKVSSLFAGIFATERDASLADAVKASGWAVPVGRRVDDIAPELLARAARLSEGGVAHLFAEGGGVVLAMSGSTADDRRRAVESLPCSPVRPLAFRRAFGVLIEAGEAGSHYSEEPGWGLTGRVGKTAPGEELEAAATCFRKSRSGSLAVAGTKAERRRIEANRRRIRAEFVARRRRGEELIVESARDVDVNHRGEKLAVSIDDIYEKVREAGWDTEVSTATY